jgi:hypothetical protein
MEHLGFLIVPESVSTLFQPFLIIMVDDSSMAFFASRQSEEVHYESGSRLWLLSTTSVST